MKSVSQSVSMAIYKATEGSFCALAFFPLPCTRRNYSSTLRNSTIKNCISISIYFYRTFKLLYFSTIWFSYLLLIIILFFQCSEVPWHGINTSKARASSYCSCRTVAPYFHTSPFCHLTKNRWPKYLARFSFWSGVVFAHLSHSVMALWLWLIGWHTTSPPPPTFPPLRILCGRQREGRDLQSLVSNLRLGVSLISNYCRAVRTMWVVIAGLPHVGQLKINIIHCNRPGGNSQHISAAAENLKSDKDATLRDCWIDCFPALRDWWMAVLGWFN